MQIYKNKNPYFKTLMALSVARIILCVAPAFFLVFLLLRMDTEDYNEAVFFAVLLVLIIITYAILSRRYRILLSGYSGERALLKIIRHITWSGVDDESAVFTNLPIIFGKNHSEIDMLLVGSRGVLIVEVKNHSGVIIGSGGDDFWLQRKKFRGREDKSVERRMLNPLFQLRRQRSILKKLLAEHGIDVWIDTVLFFSNPHVRLRLDTKGAVPVFNNQSELLKYINSYKSQRKLNREELSAVIKIIRNVSDNH